MSSNEPNTTTVRELQVGGFMRNEMMQSSKMKFRVIEIWACMLIEPFLYSGYEI